MRDPETGNSKGFGFVSFNSFDASDAAIEVCKSLICCIQSGRLFPAPLVEGFLLLLSYGAI